MPSPRAGPMLSAVTLTDYHTIPSFPVPSLLFDKAAYSRLKLNPMEPAAKTRKPRFRLAFNHHLRNLRLLEQRMMPTVIHLMLF